MQGLIIQQVTALQKFQTATDFMALTPRAAISTLSPIRDQESLIKSIKAGETPTLVSLKKEAGLDKTIAYICLWLNDLNRALDLKRCMDPEQVRECAFYLLEDFHCATIADFKFFFTNVKKGTYGTMYESLSMNKLLGWFKEFFERRCSAYYEDSIRSDESRFGVENSSDRGSSSKTYSIAQYQAVIDLNRKRNA